jgi:hypothetical protein
MQTWERDTICIWERCFHHMGKHGLLWERYLLSWDESRFLWNENGIILQKQHKTLIKLVNLRNANMTAQTPHAACGATKNEYLEGFWAKNRVSSHDFPCANTDKYRSYADPPSFSHWALARGESSTETCNSSSSTCVCTFSPC